MPKEDVKIIATSTTFQLFPTLRLPYKLFVPDQPYWLSNRKVL